EAKARGLTYRVEQCPMPGWTTADSFYNNLAYTPSIWIALRRICERTRGGYLDGAPSDLRATRRRRLLPHPLRPVPRHSDRPGYPRRLRLPEVRRVRLPGRGVSRAGASTLWAAPRDAR